MKKTEVICLQCPFACKIQVTLDDGGQITEIGNNRCPRGKSYAAQEITLPVRVLTSTVALETRDAEHPLLPVQTRSPIPKAKLFEAMDIIHGLRVKAPIRYGDVICSDIAGTGVDLISTFEVLE